MTGPGRAGDRNRWAKGCRPTAREVYLPDGPRDDEGRDDLERRFFRMIRQKNGTYKYTRANRLDDLNELVAGLLPTARPLRIMDVAVSSGISTLEWSRSLDSRGIAHAMTAGDINTRSYLISLGRRLHVLADGTGYPLQYDINGLAVPNPPARRTLPLYLPMLLLFKGALRLVFRPGIGAPGAYPGRWLRVRPIALASPRLIGHRAIELIEDDIVTNDSLRRRFDVVRAANILNASYFDEATLARIVGNLRDRLVEGGLLIICTTTGDEVEDGGFAGATNDGTVFALREAGRLEVVRRIGSGSAIERLVLGLPGPGG